ncbi:hypothetical protein K9U33_17375 [Rhodoblastus acidophilus]|uniref:hypothetical protein n=1 Tax=Candidatus Rhodoblastus alkanivorans TaxID=2954117 RepID=UPI001FA9E714|nr:hypothetical protein [Candidatus Rhodoblastus alkanivorans]MCI4680402.1 hypothetical protein [Candidatus Rhodoblastus alkanivorans]
MAYGKLDENDLKNAIAQTGEAIQRSRDLLKVVSEKPTTKGLELVAASTPLLIEKLEQDLAKLEKALEKKSKA